MILATTWLGTVPAWLTFAGVLAALFVFHGGSGGAALEVQQRANEILSTRVKQLEDDQHHNRETIAALSAKTDISIALVPLLKWCESHEALAQARTAEILASLAKVA